VPIPNLVLQSISWPRRINQKEAVMKSDSYLTGEYLAHNPTYHVEDSPWKAGQIIKMLQKHNLQPESVCEIGCGVGEILRQLQSHLPDTNMWGYDVSPQAIDLAKIRENERLHFFCEDLLNIHTTPFDLLLCIDVFEHVEDYWGFLRKMRQKGRFFVFHIPLDMTALSVFRGSQIMRLREGLGHLHYFMKETALATLKDTGYEIVDYFYTSILIDLPRSFKTYLAMRPRLLLSYLSRDLAARLLGGFSLLVLARSGATEQE
jgi:2-polyprenyl-3-methyl-5-hydroxy-6-metoxy-1,4-benzoquinol methylase